MPVGFSARCVVSRRGSSFILRDHEVRSSAVDISPSHNAEVSFFVLGITTWTTINAKYAQNHPTTCARQARCDHGGQPVEEEDRSRAWVRVADAHPESSDPRKGKLFCFVFSHKGCVVQSAKSSHQDSINILGSSDGASNVVVFKDLKSSISSFKKGLDEVISSRSNEAKQQLRRRCVVCGMRCKQSGMKIDRAPQRAGTPHFSLGDSTVVPAETRFANSEGGWAFQQDAAKLPVSRSQKSTISSRKHARFALDSQDIL